MKNKPVFSVSYEIGMQALKNDIPKLIRKQSYKRLRYVSLALTVIVFFAMLGICVLIDKFLIN